MDVLEEHHTKMSGRYTLLFFYKKYMLKLKMGLHVEETVPTS